MSQPAFDRENDIPLRQVIRDANISVEELWLYYFSLGGDMDQMELDAYLHGLMPLPRLDRSLLAQAVHEMRATTSRRSWFR